MTFVGQKIFGCYTILNTKTGLCIIYCFIFIARRWISGFMTPSILFQSYQAGALTLHVLACISCYRGLWDPCTYGNPALISECHPLYFMLKPGHIKYVLLKISLLQWGSNNCSRVNILGITSQAWQKPCLL